MPVSLVLVGDRLLVSCQEIPMSHVFFCDKFINKFILRNAQALVLVANRFLISC